MQLTPLRFITKEDSRGVHYGLSIYDTDCGRFQLAKYNEGWMIEESWLANTAGLDNNWHTWLLNMGLFNAQFTTRQAALNALSDVLGTEGLMDSQFPPA